MRIPLPFGEKKQLARKLGVHVNTLTYRWEQRDPEVIAAVQERLNELEQAKSAAMESKTGIKIISNTTIAAYRRRLNSYAAGEE